MSVIFIQVPLAGMTVKVTKRKTSTSKVILLTVNNDVEVVVTNESAPTPAPAPPTPAPPTPAPTVPAGKPYTNPLMLGADPSAPVEFNGKFYFLATGSPNVWVADSMSGPYAKGPVVMGFKPGLFAFDMWRGKDGKFYCSYSGGTPGTDGKHPNKSVGIAVSSAPNVPFTDLGYILNDCIDGNHFEDDDGKQYLYVARTKSGNAPNPGWCFWGTELDSALKPIGPLVPIFAWGSMQAWEEGTAEAPCGFRRPGNFQDPYYLIWSGGRTPGVTYSMGYARAARPLMDFAKAAGNPFAKSIGNVLGPGSCSVFWSGGRLWCSYHQKMDTVDSYNRAVCLDEITFGPNGELLMTPTRGVSMPGPR